MKTKDKYIMGISALIVTLFLNTVLFGCTPKEMIVEDTIQLGNVYDSQYALLEYSNEILATCIHQDRVYYATYKPGATADTIYSCLPDGSDIRELKGYHEYGQENVRKQIFFKAEQLLSGPNGELYVIVRKSDGAFGYPVLIRLDQNGSIVDESTLALISDAQYQKYPPSIDSEGNLYFTGKNSVKVLNSKGELYCDLTVKADLTPRQVVRLTDGQMVLLAKQGTELLSIQSIDLQTKSFDFICTISRPEASGAEASFFTGIQGYDIVASTGVSLYGYKISETSTCEQILTWLNCNVDGNGLLALSEVDEKLVCATYSTNFGGGISTLKEADGLSNDKKVLKLACRGANSVVLQQVLQFNRSSFEYRVEVQDYDIYSFIDGKNAGIDLLTTKIISGEVPDLICTEDIDVEAFIDIGLLEDLWPFIDADTELGGRDGLVLPLFNAMEENGHLYQICPGFELNSLMGAEQVVGAEPGWSWKSFWECIDNHPDYRAVMDHFNGESYVLEKMLLPYYLPQYLESGDFNSESFVNLLQFAALFPSSEATTSKNGVSFYEQLEMLANHTILTYRATGLKSPWEYETSQFYFQGQDVTYIGFPGLEGNGGVFTALTPMAMSASCENKEGAWAFLRTFLLPQGQIVPDYFRSINSDYNFPTNKKVYDALMRSMMTDLYDTDGEVLSRGSYSIGDYNVEMSAWSQNQVNELWNYICGVKVVEYMNRDVTEIIMDEADRFFAGQQTAQAAADKIQSRIDLYISERGK